jgi:hypothetical protein
MPRDADGSLRESVAERASGLWGQGRVKPLKGGGRALLGYLQIAQIWSSKCLNWQEQWHLAIVWPFVLAGDGEPLLLSTQGPRYVALVYGQGDCRGARHVELLFLAVSHKDSIICGSYQIAPEESK